MLEVLRPPWGAERSAMFWNASRVCVDLRKYQSGNVLGILSNGNADAEGLLGTMFYCFGSQNKFLQIRREHKGGVLRFIVRLLRSETLADRAREYVFASKFDKRFAQSASNLAFYPFENNGELRVVIKFNNKRPAVALSIAEIRALGLAAYFKKLASELGEKNKTQGLDDSAELWSRIGEALD
jgi:hypothetical protein